MRIDSDEFYPSYFGSDSVSLGYFEPSTTKEAEVFFDLSKNASGRVDAYLDLQYTFHGASMKKSVPFEIQVTRAPYFEISQNSTLKEASNDVRFFEMHIHVFVCLT